MAPSATTPPPSNGHSDGAVDNRPRVLVPEKLSPDGLAMLSPSLSIDERKGLTAAQLIEIIPQYDALIIRSETKVTKEVLKAAQKLKVVARAGVGVDNVDVEAATERMFYFSTSSSLALCYRNREKLKLTSYQII